MKGDRASLLDGGAVIAVGALACVARTDLRVMSLGVAAAWILRLALHRRLPADERPLPWARELALLVACAIVGYANDWNTVVRHGVYSYGPPSDLAPWSTIPAWMIGFWGLVLRLVITLGAWERLGATGPADAVRAWPRNLDARVGPRVALRVALRLALLGVLVVATRQSIYRLFAHPVASFAPFALALGAHAWLFPWGPRERRLVLVALTVGPLAEAVLIRAGLHRYELGWLLGVPIWIALWWALGVLVLAELGRRAVALATPGRRAEPAQAMVPLVTRDTRAAS